MVENRADSAEGGLLRIGISTPSRKVDLFYKTDINFKPMRKRAAYLKVPA